MWGGLRIETRLEERFRYIQLDQLESVLWWVIDKLQKRTGKADVHKQGTEKKSVLERVE
jgi:hypothetical protein